MTNQGSAHNGTSDKSRPAPSDTHSWTPSASIAEYRIVAADPIAGVLILRGLLGTYWLRQHEQGFAILRDGDHSPLGSVVPGCSWAGSIWMGRTCIGEYERLNGVYRITPIEGRNLQPDRLVIGHPVDYVLRKAEEVAHEVPAARAVRSTAASS